MSTATMNRRAPAPEPPRQGGFLRKLCIGALALFLALVLFGVAAAKGLVPAPIINGFARIFIARQADALPWRSDQPMNVLILGLQIGGASTNPLTDSLMTVSYDPKSESLGMLSVPRDLWVTIPGHGEGRINEAFQDGGAAGAMITVQQNLGVPVNYYALISYDAFEKLIDDVGGINVDVPRDMDDPTYPAADEIHFEPFQITKGPHHLNGHEALRYARTRHADPLGDIGRAERQQQVLMALKSQILRPTNVMKLPLIMKDVRSTIRTNFPLDQAAGLGLKILRAKNDNVRQDVLQYDNKAVQGYVTPGGASVLLPNKAAVKQIVSNVFGPTLSYLQAGATVRVDNGNGYNLAGTGFSNILKGMGVKTVDPGDADRKDYPQHHVKVYTKDSAKVAEAALIAGMLGVELEKGDGKDSVDIVVTLGRNYAPFVKFGEADWQNAIKPQ